MAFISNFKYFKIDLFTGIKLFYNIFADYSIYNINHNSNIFRILYSKEMGFIKGIEDLQERIKWLEGELHKEPNNAAYNEEVARLRAKLNKIEVINNEQDDAEI